MSSSKKQRIKFTTKNISSKNQLWIKAIADGKVIAVGAANGYGYRYILYTPIGHYVGHHRVMQPSPNGYGYSPIPEGGEGSSVPCFQTIREAKHYYYPQWY